MSDWLWGYICMHSACMLLKFLPWGRMSAPPPEAPMTNQGMILPKFTLGNEWVYLTPFQSICEGLPPGGTRSSQSRKEALENPYPEGMMAFPQLPWWSTPSCHSHLYPPAPPKTPRHVQLGQSCIQLIGRGSWILRWVTNYPHNPLPMREDKHSTALLWWSLPASPAEFLKMVSVSLGRGSEYVCRVCSRACGGQIRSSAFLCQFSPYFLELGLPVSRDLEMHFV